MEREILFRGQDLFTKEWRYGFYYESEHGMGYIQIQPPGEKFNHWQVYPETVGQYTGRKDSEGQKIFEGDIIEAWVKNPGIIVFDKGSFFGIKYKNNLTTYLCKYGTHELKKIGNIHDNPELLSRQEILDN